jgi:hypothetical protein
MALHLPKLSDCLNEIFGPGNILNNQNLPELDTRVPEAAMDYAMATVKQPVPATGRGTVLIATESFNNPKSSNFALAAAYLHEVGNIMVTCPPKTVPV